MANSVLYCPFPGFHFSPIRFAVLGTSSSPVVRAITVAGLVAVACCHRADAASPLPEKGSSVSGCDTNPKRQRGTSLALRVVVTAAEIRTPKQKSPEKPIATGAAASEAEKSWTLFRGDPLATGVARSTLPEKLQLLWTFSVKNGGFDSSAAIDGGKVFIGSVNGKLYGIDLITGKQVWEFGTQLGFTASPAIRHGLVYIGDSDGRFHCVDAGTGKEKWHFDTEAEIDSSANFHDDHVLLGSQDGNLYCLKCQTGDLVWKYKSENQIRCFPTVVDDRAFVAGCDARLHVIELKQGRQVAETPLDSPTGSTPAVMNNMLFVGTEGKEFFGIDWQRPKVVWKYEPPQRGALSAPRLP